MIFLTSFSVQDEPGRQQPFDPISPFLGCLQPGGLDFLKISHNFLQLIEIVKQIFAVSLSRSGLLAHRAATRPGESCCCSRCRKEEGTQILSWKVEYFFCCERSKEDALFTSQSVCRIFGKKDKGLKSRSGGFVTAPLSAQPHFGETEMVQVGQMGHIAHRLVVWTKNKSIGCLIFSFSVGQHGRDRWSGGEGRL